jgi:hypothetical protein
MLQKDFIKKWIDKIDSSLLKKFPDDFFENEKTKEIVLPSTTLTLGAELFGFHEINDTMGNVIYQAQNFTEAKYILYASRYKLTKIKVPIKHSDISSMVLKYDNYLDLLIRAIKKDFENEFPESKSFNKISNTIFNNLRLQRY